MFVQCEMCCIKIKMKYKRVSYLCVSSRISVLAVYPSACAIKHWHFDRNAGERNKRCIRGDERVLIHNQAVFSHVRPSPLHPAACLYYWATQPPVARNALRIWRQPPTFLQPAWNAQSARRRSHDGKGKWELCSPVTGFVLCGIYDYGFHVRKVIIV